MPSYHDRMSSYDHRMSTPPDFLSQSTGSISMSASARAQASHIAKSYRQAAQLFLTRRLPEALSTIEPIITSPTPDLNASADTVKVLAPIATASKGTRVKVWSFYLTFLNAVIELGPEEGKHAFGSTRWRGMVNMVRDGSIWEEVVQSGYSGNEGAVDHDVVINLATLLLTHSPSQKLTQTRLETYLSALSHPTFDIASHMAARQNKYQRFSTASAASGTNTPRDLATHLKILELYTLHVLPRNGEWDYAREFIMMSEIMDDERKETFLQALHGLKEEQENALLREKEIQRRQREEAEMQRKQEELDRREAEDQRRQDEEEQSRRKALEANNKQNTSRPPPDTRSNAARPTTPTPSSRNPRTALSPTPINTRSQNTNNKKSVIRKQPSIISRASTVIAALQTTLMATANGLRNNPMALLRTMLFLLAFALAFGRQEIRERVKRLLAGAGEKLRATVGMGVKVSYI